ncbi:retrovirus-related pol polyprotein from transposon TNT 1-94 [Tanacetum coccineum]
MKKMYCLVVTNDYSRCNTPKLGRSGIWVRGVLLLRSITQEENLIDLKVKVIRCDSGTEFKNRVMNQLCEMKAEAVNTACRKPALSFIRPFGCPVIVLNTIDHQGKFDGKADEGFFVGYSTNSKAFRVFNSRTRIVEENLHVQFSENTSNIAGSGPNWLFDIDALTNSMNYKPVVARNLSNSNAVPPFSSSLKDSPDAGFKPSGEEEKKDAKDPGNESGNPTEGKDTDDEAFGFEDLDFPDKVYKVEKALYGLHQAPKSWRDQGDILIVQVYVDDIIFGSTKKKLCTEFEKMMHKKFHINSIGELTFFLGLQVKQKEDGIFISQDTYVTEILKKISFSDVKTANTPMETHKPLLKDTDGEDVDEHIYLKDQPKLGLWYPKDSPFDLVAYTDSDYAGASLDRKSTTGGCQFLGCRLISWQCKKQTVVANSITEAEYVAASSCCGQIVDFLNESSIKYALTVNPTIYTSCIEQFWSTAKAKTVNWEVQLQTLVDGKKIVITEASVRRDLQLEDANGVDCLPNATIFKKLTLMGKDFSGRVTPLFSTMMVQAQQEQGEDEAVNEENVSKHCNDPLLSALEIDSLKRRVKKIEKKQRSRTHRLRRLYKVGLSAKVVSSEDEGLGEEDASKQGRKIHDIDADEDITLENVHDADMFGVHDFDGDESDCEIDGNNIILQRDYHQRFYALVRIIKSTKELERIQLLMRGANRTSFKKQEREYPLALVATHQMTQSPYQTHQNSYQNSQFQPQVSLYQSPQHGSPYQSQQCSSNQLSTPLSITYPSNDYQSSVYHNVYSPSSSIPQLEYAPTVNQQSEFPQLDSDVNNSTLIKRAKVLSECEFISLWSGCSQLVKESLMQTVTLLKNGFKKEESRNIDREIALEKKIKQLDNMFIKEINMRQTSHVYETLVFYDHTTKTSFRLAEETLMLAEESRSKMLLKEKDPMMLKKKVNTTPLDYAVLNQLSQDFETRFVPQTKLSAEQAFWSQNSVNSPNPTLSSRPTKVDVPKELPKVSMVNTSLKKLKHHLVGFDVVIKERTTATAITKGSWGFEHTKACFRDEIIPFVKALKDLFNTFDHYLIDELSEVQNVIHQMEQVVEQHRLESKTFQVKMIQVLNKNERLLEQVINKDIVNIIMNSSVDNASVNVHECEQCLKFETKLLKKEDFEIFQRDNSVSNQSAPSFDQLFELNELKAQSQEKGTVIKKLKERIKSLSGKMNEDKIKNDLEEIETINIELDHRVSKLIAENEHLKQTYKQLYDSIKPARIQSKELCDGLINQVNLKSVEIFDLNARLHEKVLVITTLKDELRKLKGKYIVDNAVMKHTIDPEMLKNDVEPITPKLLNNRTTHSAYIKHTQEEAAILRDLVEHVKANYPLDHPLEPACRYTKRIQDLLTNISKTCPSINNSGEKLVAMTPKSKDKRVRFTEHVTSSGNTYTKIASSSNLVSNKPMLSSTGHSKLNANSEVKCVKCNGCMISDNHDLCVLDFINNVNARIKSKSAKKNSKRKVWKPTGKVFTNIGYIWRPTGQTFTIVGNVCPLTRITTTTKVPLWKPTALNNETSKPVVTLVYSQKPRKSKTNVSVSKSKVLKSVSANKKEPSQSWGSIVSDVPSSSLDECMSSKLFSEGVDLLTGSRGNNLYTLSLGDMTAFSPICLLSKASKTKSWLWHRHLSHLNFGAINHLARHGLVRGLPKLKFKKDHLCSACAMGKSEKKSHKPKSKDTNQEKLYLLHMDLCQKDEALDFIIKFLKMIQVWLKVPVRRIRKDNGTEFVNQTLHEYYEKVGISHETFVARSPQQNDVVERPFATACYTQNCSIIRLRHGKTPYELLHDKLPDLSFFHVFGALCYPTNDSENLGKLQPKADIDFDELTVMASEHSSSGPALHEMTPATIIALEPVASTGSPSSTTVDQDAPSTSNSQTTPETQSPVIPNDVEEDNHDLDVAHMNNDPYFGIPIPEVPSDQSSSTDIIHTIMHPDHQISKHNSKWTKDHPLENIIGELARPVSIRLQLHEQALFCYNDAFLTTVEPKTYKDALTQSCWIEAMQEDLIEFERLEVWELVPRPDKVFLIEDLKTNYKAQFEVAARSSAITKVFAPETVREIVEEARVVKPLDNVLNYACQYTKLSQELVEYVIGTCPKEFTERDSKAPSIPLTRKKQVTFTDTCSTSTNNTQKHRVHQRKSIPILMSGDFLSGVRCSTRGNGSKPRKQYKAQ